MPGKPKPDGGADAPVRMLYFVRHGQYVSEGADEGRLTPLGRRQAAQLAKHFRRLPIDLVRSSDLPRAFETATILAARLKIRSIERHAVLREMLPTELPGLAVPLKKRKDARRRLGRIVERFFTGSKKPRHEVVVCHGNLIRSLVLRLAVGDPAGFHHFSIHHASVTSFSVSSNGKVTIVGFNLIEHVPPRMRTFV